MAQNRLKANICGTSYTLVSDEPLGYMRELVAQVDEAMTALVENDLHMSTTMAAVLTAVQSTDRANKESEAANALRREMKRAIDEIEQLKDRLAQEKSERDRLQKEIAQLRSRRP